MDAWDETPTHFLNLLLEGVVIPPIEGCNPLMSVGSTQSNGTVSHEDNSSSCEQKRTQQQGAVPLPPS